MTQQLRAELESELTYFMDFDPRVKSTAKHQYCVRSLYFDDPHSTCFYDKVEGLHTRSKFRVRTYTDNPQVPTPQFLEIKGRCDNVAFKHRTQLNSAGIVSYERGEQLVGRVQNGIGDCNVARQFCYDLYRKQIRPIALVDYLRRPYIGKFDPEYRLTFDSELKGTRTNCLFPSGSQPQSRSLLRGYTVLEVKFRQRIPAWFHGLIQAYELRRVSVSKICLAMEALGIAEDPR